MMTLLKGKKNCKDKMNDDFDDMDKERSRTLSPSFDFLSVEG
jgi:hypothetical protein